jgi:hypothetical protein
MMPKKTKPFGWATHLHHHLTDVVVRRDHPDLRLTAQSTHGKHPECRRTRSPWPAKWSNSAPDFGPVARRTSRSSSSSVRLWGAASVTDTDGDWSTNPYESGARGVTKPGGSSRVGRSNAPHCCAEEPT